ncbi:MAG: flagellar basal body rod protein FlgB [Candidatus Lambdaproteobacteria bacterium]|nr:flagellar basal body rod protein FlgB [Candidatus Lambdaproteobacteria bacterium]
MSGLFDSQIRLIERSLDFRAQRNALLSSNIANVETPGYKSRDLVFEKALGEALHHREPGPLRVTNPRHMDGNPHTPLELVKPHLIHAATPVGSVDGNTVDLEREMAKLGENQLAYQALSTMISHKFANLKNAIRGDSL